MYIGLVYTKYKSDLSVSFITRIADIVNGGRDGDIVTNIWKQTKDAHSHTTATQYSPESNQAGKRNQRNANWKGGSQPSKGKCDS